MGNMGFWVVVGIAVFFVLILTANSGTHKTKSKMDMNRRSNSKILNDYDEEQNFIDKYSR